MKANALKRFNIGYFILCLIVLSCLSYGCGGGARDIIIVETQKKYVSTVVNEDGTMRYFNSETQITVEAPEKNSLPAGSEIYIVERQLYSNEVSIYGDNATKVLSLSGLRYEYGIQTELKETEKPINIRIPNTFPEEFTEFYVGYRASTDTDWQFQKLPESGKTFIESQRLSYKTPSEFVITTFHLNYTFTIFGVNPNAKKDDSISVFEFSAVPEKFEVATDTFNNSLFKDDLKITSKLTSEIDSNIFNESTVENQVTFYTDSPQTVSFKVDGNWAKEYVSSEKEYNGKYLHRISINSYLPENTGITGNTAVYSFVLNLKDTVAAEFPDEFRVKAILITKKGVFFSNEGYLTRRNITKNPLPPEPLPEETITLSLIEPNPTTNVSLGSKVVLRADREIEWREEDNSKIALVDNNGGKINCSYLVGSNKKDITLIPNQSFIYNNSYSVTVFREALAQASNLILASATYSFSTISPTAVAAVITDFERNKYNGKYKLRPEFNINFKKPVGSLSEVAGILNVKCGSDIVAYKLNFEPTNTIATLTFTNDLIGNADYSISMSGPVKDVDNIDIAPFNVINFTTLPKITAQITPTNPEAGGKIATNTAFVIDFSDKITWNSETPSFITLKDFEEHEIACVKDFDGNKSVTVTPSENLLHNTKYVLQIHDGIGFDDSEQAAIATAQTFETPDGQHFAATVKAYDDDVIEPLAVPIVCSPNATFTIDFVTTPADIAEAEAAIKVYSSIREVTVFNREWNVEHTKMDISFPEDVLFDEMFTISFDEKIYDTRNVAIGNFPTFIYKTGPYAGRGTAESPYLVSTAKQFDYMRKYVNCYFKQTCDIDLSTYTSSPLIPDLATNGFLPIGTMDDSWSGHFDGDYHTIYGLNINRPDTMCVGLFGMMMNGSISNVKLDNSHHGKVVGDNYVGGILGVAMETTISQCVCEMEVVGNMAVAGIAAEIDYGSVYDCVFAGKITGDTQVCGMVSNLFGGEIHNSYNVGEIVDHCNKLIADQASNCFVTSQTIVCETPCSDYDDSPPYCVFLEHGYKSEIEAAAAESKWTDESDWLDESIWILSEDSLPKLKGFEH